MKIYVIRHGETDWNAQYKLQGRSDIPLNEKGRALAAETAEALKDVKFDVCFSSPLSRAHETAEIILGDRPVEIINDERLIEIGFGVCDGMQVRDPQTREISVKNWDYFLKAPEKYETPENAESMLELCERVKGFVEELVAREDLEDKTILIATHGAALRGILNAIREWELSDFWGKGLSRNCAVSILESHKGQVKLLEENKVFYRI